MHQRPDTGAHRYDREENQQDTRELRNRRDPLDEHGDRDAAHDERTGRRLDLSVPQVAGSALAAVAAAVLASRLGVYGTIIGAGVVSVVATCGGSVFQHLFSRTGDQMRGATTRPRRLRRPGEAARHTLSPLPDGPYAAAEPPDATAAWPRAAPGAQGFDGTAVRDGKSGGEFGAPTTHGTRGRRWKRPLVAAAVVFGVAMTGITGYEVLSGSGLDGGNGTTVGSVVRGDQDGGSPPKDAPSTPPADERDQQRTEDRERQQEEQAPDPDRPQQDEPTKPAPDPKESTGPSTDPDPDDPADPSQPAPPPAQPSPPVDGRPGTEGGAKTSGASPGAGTGGS
ncbi:hypothetical protein ACH41E_06550 [Streptomyces sp. NPDC020412]|uniref:hypothetical protein n=1 Tax=Streptomyces sp. NPDC020412 TaxID=3365073 RepID=UPI0037966068